MTKVFKGIFHKKTKDTNACYVKLQRCENHDKSFEIRMILVNNEGKMMFYGNLVAISNKGLYRHVSVTKDTDIPIDCMTKVKIKDF